jgi:hypothetical protein
MSKIVVESDDFGGLSFKGSKRAAINVASELRALIDTQESTPNYLSDFVLAIEVATGELGLDAES